METWHLMWHQVLMAVPARHFRADDAIRLLRVPVWWVAELLFPHLPPPPPTSPRPHTDLTQSHITPLLIVVLFVVHSSWSAFCPGVTWWFLLGDLSGRHWPMLTCDDKNYSNSYFPYIHQVRHSSRRRRGFTRCWTTRRYDNISSRIITNLAAAFALTFHGIIFQTPETCADPIPRFCKYLRAKATPRPKAIIQNRNIMQNHIA